MIDAPDVLAHEREKYSEIWGIDEYRKYSPGLENVERFMEVIDPPPQGKTLIDFGCGDGRAGLEFEKRGLRVSWMDLTDAGLVPEIDRKRFVQQAIWHKPIKPARRGLKFDYGFCFPAHTVVGGSTAFIDTLDRDALVGNAHGIEQKVKKTFSRTYSGRMASVSVATLPTIEMTAEHPVLVSKLRRIHRKNNFSHDKSAYEWIVEGQTWKPAQELTSDDWVSVPRLTGSEVPKLRFLKHGNGNNVVEYDVDTGLAWLLGLYVAEGHTAHENKGGKVYLTLNRKEQALADRAVSLFKRIGISASIRKPPSLPSILTVCAYNGGFARLVDEWCGRGANNKIIPEPIKFAHPEIIRAFISGLVDGDGCLRGGSGNSYYSIVTVSKRLAFGVLELLHKLGVNGRLANPTKHESTTILGRVCNTLPAYTVAWSERSWVGTGEEDSRGRVPYGHARYIGDHVYLPVKEVTFHAVSDMPVFNIETEDHTYGVPFTVHNCCDVMEHIPPEYTMLAISRMIESCELLWLQICLTPDNFGMMIGEPLHLTVQPFRWWLSRIASLADIQDTRDLIDTGLYVVSAK